MKIIEVRREQAMAAALRRVAQTGVVLDVGPGIQPQTYFRPRTHVCVEAHRPYVDRLLADRAGDPSLVCLCGTWQQVLPLFPDRSVDTAFALDVIEHLSREDGFALLAEMRRIARVQVVIFTPLGMYPQSYEHGELDAWGMDGGHWQTHRSGWTPDDLAGAGTGWEAVVSRDFHRWDQHGQPLQEPFGAFWAIQTLSPVPAGARHAWSASRMHRVRARSRQQLDRLRRFAADPVNVSRRVLRRLAGAR